MATITTTAQTLGRNLMKTQMGEHTMISNNPINTKAHHLIIKIKEFTCQSTMKSRLKRYWISSLNINCNTI